MKVVDVEAIVAALNAADVCYLIVGGLAVAAHGYLRYTKDVDLVLRLERDNVLRALKSLEDLGYRPRVPVESAQFADETTRESWIEERGMILFSMINLAREDTIVDLFVREPFDVVEEFRLAEWKEVSAAVRAPILRLGRLLEMKRAAGCPQDLADVDQLELMLRPDL